MTLIFSPQPGPRERQLQRKYNKPIFGAVAITQQAVQAAQQQDQVVLQQFMEQFRELVERAVKLDKNVESDVVLLLKAQLEQQYAVCVGLPGETKAIKDAIKKLIAAISSTLRETSKNDPDALEKLANDEEHTQLHFQLCDYAIVSDILSPDDIISEAEQLPTLLGESDDALEAVLLLLPPDRIQALIEQGKALLGKVEADGHDMTAARQNLALMERWLQAE
jgi:molybdopterin biosynthesis enzyme MoaB